MSFEISKTLRIFVASAAAMIQLSGCQSLDTVRVRDDSARAFNATLISRPEEMRYGRNGRMQGGVEFAYERYRGSSVQGVDARHFLSLEQGTIAGPQQSTNSADIHHGHIAYNQLFNFGQHFQIEPAFGVTFDKIEATAQGSAPGSRLLEESQHNWGGLFAITPRWNFNQYLGIESRFNVGGNFGGTNVSGNTTSFVVSPTPHLALKAGYYTRDYEFETPEGQSNLEPCFSGFAGTVTVIF